MFCHFSGNFEKIYIVEDSVGKWEIGESSEFFFLCVCFIYGFRSCVVSVCWFFKHSQYPNPKYQAVWNDCFPYDSVGHDFFGTLFRISIFQKSPE